MGDISALLTLARPGRMLQLIDACGFHHGAAAAWMLCGWALFIATNNAGWVDVAWSTCLAALAMLNMALTPRAARTFQQWALTSASIAWGARIGLHVAVRSVWKQPEEMRYRWLRQQWREGANELWLPWLPIASERVRFLLFYLGQGALNSFVLSASTMLPRLAGGIAATDHSWAGEANAPAKQAIAGKAPAIAAAAFPLGVAMWAAGFAIEWLADEQLRRFLTKRASVTAAAAASQPEAEAVTASDGNRADSEAGTSQRGNAAAELRSAPNRSIATTAAGGGSGTCRDEV